ncbi:hypothetical protein [Ktedonobacter racemifer]|nr:hypothetical protein [Ktedonobacter racemifer]
MLVFSDGDDGVVWGIEIGDRAPSKDPAFESRVAVQGGHEV